MPASATKPARAKKPPASVKPDSPVQPDLTPEMLAFLHIFSLGCGKIGYKHADAAVEMLLKHKKRGVVSLPDDVSLLIAPLLGEFERFALTLSAKKFRIADDWRGKSKVNTGSNVRRYSLEEVTSP